MNMPNDECSLRKPSINVTLFYPHLGDTEGQRYMLPSAIHKRTIHKSSDVFTATTPVHPSTTTMMQFLRLVHFFQKSSCSILLTLSELYIDNAIVCVLYFFAKAIRFLVGYNRCDSLPQAGCYSNCSCKIMYSTSEHAPYHHDVRRITCMG